VRARLDDDPATELVVEIPGRDRVAVGQKVWVRAGDTGIAWTEPSPNQI
jgi:hypothetical protein